MTIYILQFYGYNTFMLEGSLHGNILQSIEVDCEVDKELIKEINDIIIKNDIIDNPSLTWANAYKQYREEQDVAIRNAIDECNRSTEEQAMAKFDKYCCSMEQRKEEEDEVDDILYYERMNENTLLEEWKQRMYDLKASVMYSKWLSSMNDKSVLEKVMYVNKAEAHHILMREFNFDKQLVNAFIEWNEGTLHSNWAWYHE